MARVAGLNDSAMIDTLIQNGMSREQAEALVANARKPKLSIFRHRSKGATEDNRLVIASVANGKVDSREVVIAWPLTEGVADLLRSILEDGFDPNNVPKLTE